MYCAMVRRRSTKFRGQTIGVPLCYTLLRDRSLARENTDAALPKYQYAMSVPVQHGYSPQIYRPLSFGSGSAAASSLQDLLYVNTTFL